MATREEKERQKLAQNVSSRSIPSGVLQQATVEAEPQSSVVERGQFMPDGSFDHLDNMGRGHDSRKPVVRGAYAMACVCLVGIMLAVFVVIQGSSGGSSSSRGSSSSSPEDSSPEKLPNLEDLLNQLPPQTHAAVVEGIGSPQQLAWYWISKDSSLHVYDVDYKLRRFALATMYFAGRLRENARDTYWLVFDDARECYWYPRSDGTSECDKVSQSGLHSPIQLVGESMGGTIQPEIALLTDLVILDLSMNKIEGTIPDELWSLSNLRDLDLRFTHFHGTLSTEIGRLTNLQRLALKHTFFTGTLPTEIGLLTQLEELSLGNTRLTAPIPTELQNLTQLRTLDLVNSKLTTDIPDWVYNMEGLRLCLEEICT